MKWQQWISYRIVCFYCAVCAFLVECCNRLEIWTIYVRDDEFVPVRSQSVTLHFVSYRRHPPRQNQLLRSLDRNNSATASSPPSPSAAAAKHECRWSTSVDKGWNNYFQMSISIFLVVVVLALQAPCLLERHCVRSGCCSRCICRLCTIFPAEASG